MRSGLPSIRFGFDAIYDLAYLNSNEGAFEQEYITDPTSDYQRMMRAGSQKLYNHKASNHAEIAIKKLQMIPPECGKEHLPKELTGNQQFSGTWGRLKWDSVSPTIDTIFDASSNGTNNHPFLHRAITPREVLLDKTVNDPIHIVIFLAAYYGLRRSEVLGLKWSAVDFENKTVSISHKVVQNDKGVVGMDVMKTKSSYRTLPLIPQVEQVLLNEKEKQEEMKRVMRRGYCKKYTDYICVDAIGELIKPNYVTDHFKMVLKENGL